MQIVKPAMSENLIQKILEFQAVSEALEPSENERGHYVDEVNDYANAFLKDLKT